MSDEVVLDVRGLSVYYGMRQAVVDATFPIKRNTVTAILGPSGCGKTTLMKAISRNLDITEGSRVSGQILLDGEDIFFSTKLTTNEMRRRACYVAQIPQLFDTSISKNLLLPLRFWNPGLSRKEAMDRVEDVLHAVGMWDVTKNRLDSPAKKLSAGEGQKLCLARALIIEPYLLLLDEPTANIDPISASMLEELLDELRSRTTIMMITHSMRQGARISQQVIFMHLR